MAVGLISSANPTQPANLNGISFSQAITRLMPNGQAPLFGLTSLLKDETANNIEHGYFSKTMLFQSMTLNAAVADGVATTFTVLSSADVTAGDLFLVNGTTATEIVMINTIPNGTSVTVTRGVGSTAAAAISNSTVLYHIGNAFEEASTRPSAVSIVAARYTLTADGESVEFALLIDDRWQRSGLGRRLMGALMDCARDRSYRYIVGDVLADNEKMLRLMTNLGFSVLPHPDGPDMKRVLKPLQE